MPTPFRLSTLAHTALLLLFGLACFGPSATAEEKPTTPPKEKAKATKTPVFALVSQGSEPRRVLQYAPATGTKLDFSSSTLIVVTHPMGKMNIGPIKSTVRVAYDKRTADAQTPVSAEITAASMKSDGSYPRGAQMKSTVEATKGSKATGTLTANGVFQKTPAKDDAPTGKGNLIDEMRRFSPRLPTEAVGVGAKWTTTVLTWVNNIPQTSVVTTEITKIEGTRVELSVKEARSAKDQKTKIMGQEVPVKSVTGTGKGTATLDLALGGVVKSTHSLTTEMIMFFMGSDMTTTTVLTSSLSSKPAAAVAVTEKK